MCRKFGGRAHAHRCSFGTAKKALQGGNVPVGIGDDGVVDKAARGVCLNVLDPPVHEELLQPGGTCI